MREVITEKLVAHIWQHQLIANPVTDAEEEISIISPGRLCTDGGGDFCDAVLIIGNRVTRGNVEVHVRSSQWYSHGHHRDSRYNDIVLHVVMWHDCSTATVLQNGKTIPCVCLSLFLKFPLSMVKRKINLLYRCPSPCHGARNYFGSELLSEVLITAGKKRFAAKVTLFQEKLLSADSGQVLFRNIAKALGYEKNSEPCETLADQLTLRLLEDRNNAKGILIQQALILGTAGLLPSQRLPGKNKGIADSEITELEMMWRASRITRAMNSSCWRFFRVRPNNSPTRRLIALSYLISRYSQFGLLRGILKLVKESPGNNGHRRIEDGLIIQSQGYWKNHSDFGIDAPKSAALLGRSKAGEIAINIILPFVYAWGTLNAKTELIEKVVQIYLDYPRLEDNQILRFMRQQLCLRPDHSLLASQQQGLLHIFRNYCRQKNCGECPITINQS